MLATKTRPKRSGIQVLLKLVVLVKPLILQMCLAIILGVLGHLTAIFIPVFGVQAFMHVLAKTPITQDIIFLLLFGITRGFFRYGEQYTNHYIAFTLLAIIRDKVFTALRRLAPAKLETKNSGMLISIITGDIELLEIFYAHTISPIMIAFIVSIFMIGYLARFHILLALVAMCSYLAVGVLLPWVINKLRKNRGEHMRLLMGEMATFLLESIRGLKELFMFQNMQTREQQLQEQSHALNRNLFSLKTFDANVKTLIDVVIYSCNLVMIVTVFILLSQNKIDFFVAITAVVGLMSSYGPLISLTNLSTGLVQTIESGQRVLDILEETPEVAENVSGIQHVIGEKVTLKEVTFGYQEAKIIIENFNLKATAGEIIGIVAPSGKGKSTLIKLIMRFWDVKSGSIDIDNHNLKEIMTTNLRDIEGYVTQDTYLFKKTIAENLLLAKPEATEAELVRACEKAAIHDFIMTLPNGYQTLVSELGDNFSSGQRQRLGLARIFLHDSQIILLDEPTSNLDILNEKDILRAIKEHMEDKVVILVSHKETTLEIADRIVYL